MLAYEMSYCTIQHQFYTVTALSSGQFIMPTLQTGREKKQLYSDKILHESDLMDGFTHRFKLEFAFKFSGFFLKKKMDRRVVQIQTVSFV